MKTETPEVRIKADKIIEGEPYRKCPNCKALKPLNDFGLRNLDGGKVIANQSWCRGCR